MKEWFLSNPIWIMVATYVAIRIIVSVLLLERTQKILLSEEKKKDNLEYNEILHIIDSTMLQIFEFRVRLFYDVKRDGFVFNFDRELKILVNAIMGALSPDLIRQAERFVNRSHVIAYVTKKSELFLIEKIKLERQ